MQVPSGGTLRKVLRAARFERALSYTLAVNGWTRLVGRILSDRLTRRMATYPLHCSKIESDRRLGMTINCLFVCLNVSLYAGRPCTGTGTF